MKFEIMGDSKFHLVWDSFDGDDCFDIHYVEIQDGDKIKRYDFDACAVRACRKIINFIETENCTEVSFGFRNPDIVYYSLKRTNCAFELTVNYEERNLSFGHMVPGISTDIDKKFIYQYYGENT